MVEKGRGFQVFAHILLVFLSLCAVAPFILLIMSSFTEEQTLITNGYSFFPEKFSSYAYAYLLTDSTAVVRGYGISFLVTAVGTVLNLLLTTLYAYPLSRKDLPCRNIFAFYLFFTMLFSGGLVPSYMMWTQTFHIRNTLVALLVPNLLMGAFNVIMMRTYFTANIPDAVIEAARIQVLLMNIQRDLDSLRQQAQSGGNVNSADLPSTSVRMALTVMGVLPIMIIYPFMQKYFVKGIAIGAVKG